MKRWYPALILLCLLLAGCSGKGEETTFPTQTEAVPMEAAPPAGLHDPNDPLEMRYGDALRAYPLSIPGVAGLKAMGSDLLVFSDTQVSTLITRLSGEELYIAATVRLEFGLSPDDPSLQVTESGLSYFDPVNRQTVVLDASLREITHIPAPEDLEGTPLLSRDRETLYYCTKAGIRAWNLETGIRRVIKEAGFAQQSVTGLHLNDTVLQCRVADNEGNASTLLLSTESGRQIFVTGHPEYDLFTLDAEYRRDLEKGLEISVPENYYPSDDPAQRPINRWRSHAHLLYHNWLNYYVYQTTPYDLEELSPLAGEPR